MAGPILCFAGLFGCGWAIGLKAIDGLATPLPLLFGEAATPLRLGRHHRLQIAG